MGTERQGLPKALSFFFSDPPKSFLRSFLTSQVNHSPKSIKWLKINFRRFQIEKISNL
jgi:hypothetical protein